MERKVGPICGPKIYIFFFPQLLEQRNNEPEGFFLTSEKDKIIINAVATKVSQRTYHNGIMVIS